MAHLDLSWRKQLRISGLEYWTEIRETQEQVPLNDGTHWVDCGLVVISGCSLPHRVAVTIVVGAMCADLSVVWIPVKS